MQTKAPQLWDISPTLQVGFPVWPGDTPYKSETTWQMSETCPVLVSAVTFSTHIGAHCDAPAHYDPNGLTIDEVNLNDYLGQCRVIEAIGVQQILPQHVLPFLNDIPARVLLKTYEKAPRMQWDSHFASFSPATIDVLAQHGVKLIGIDTPSFDPEDSKTLDAHHRMRHHQLSILEGIVLDDVAAGDYELICLPLKLKGLDASPVRAILRRS